MAYGFFSILGAEDSSISQNEGVTGVKGSAESNYRKGNVNLTAANIGALATSELTTKASAIALHKMSFGAADANTTNCPAGALYGKYEG